MLPIFRCRQQRSPDDRVDEPGAPTAEFTANAPSIVRVSRRLNRLKRLSIMSCLLEEHTADVSMSAIRQRKGQYVPARCDRDILTPVCHISHGRGLARETAVERRHESRRGRPEGPRNLFGCLNGLDAGGTAQRRAQWRRHVHIEGGNAKTFVGKSCRYANEKQGSKKDHFL